MGKLPKSSILIGFSLKKNINFGGFPTICGNTQVDLYVSAVTGQGPTVDPKSSTHIGPHRVVPGILLHVGLEEFKVVEINP